MPSPLRIQTPRLTLVAVTRELAHAALHDRPLLARLLDAELPPDWPQDVIADVLGMIHDRLAADPSRAGWMSWHVLAGSGIGLERMTVVGNVGVGGFDPPGETGIAVVGYGVLPAYQGRGIASEATLAVMRWALHHPGLRVFHATTFEAHHTSRRVLDKLGFTLAGVSPDDAQAAESDRQGRGKLLLFSRGIEGL